MIAIPLASAAPKATKAQKDLPQLTMVVGVYAAIYANEFIANWEGFFKKAGVQVNIVNGGSQLGPIFISGRSDLDTSGPSAALSFVAQGKPVKVIYANTFGVTEGFVVKADSPVHTALDLCGHSFGSFGVGTALGVAVKLNAYCTAHGRPALNLVTLAAPGGDYVGLVAGGTIDTTYGTPSTVIPYIQQGQVRWVSDLAPGSPIMQQLIPPTVVGNSYFVTADTLNAKRDAIVRFIAGVRMADRWMARHSDKTIATVLYNAVPGFNATPLSTLVTTVKYYRPVWGASRKSEGYIPQSAWAASLAAFGDFGLGLDVSQPQFSYPQAVDMTVWNDATKIVNKLYPKIPTCGAGQQSTRKNPCAPNPPSISSLYTGK
jgi:ABC-type nitrate/sulfonate/bicarbonate transport system substrate-binding protein